MNDFNTIYIPQKCSDMTEGRGPMVDMDGFYTTEQAAWDFIGDRPGIMGRHPAAGQTWQTETRLGDYGVRAIKRSINDAAEPLPSPGAFVRDRKRTRSIESEHLSAPAVSPETKSDA